MTSMRWALCLALLGCASVARAEIDSVPESVSCSPAVALVFGEEFGVQSTLPGVAKDARDMKRALEAVGVKTKLLLNQDVAAARSALKAFARDKPGALHILYIAGAGGEEAKAPGRLWFLAAALEAIPENVEQSTLAFDEIAAGLGQGGQPSIIIIDSSLGDVRVKTERQVVLLAGDHGRADEAGGYFTQAIVGRLFEAAGGVGTELLDVFRISSATARAKTEGVQDPMLLLRGSSPAIKIREGAVACSLPR